MPDTQSILEMTLKMLLAVLLGGVVGYERETHGRPAGLRTHILVCLGAALFTIASIQIAGTMFDPGRITAQIVSGIGFLGAGTIIRQGSVVRGLTTAASLWTVAAIGVAVGIGRDGMAFTAIIASAVTFATLSTINRIEHTLISRRRYRDLVVTIEGGRGNLPSVTDKLVEQGLEVMGIEAEDSSEAGLPVFRMHLRIPPGFNTSAISESLGIMPIVRQFQWD